MNAEPLQVRAEPVALVAGVRPSVQRQVRPVCLSVSLTTTATDPKEKTGTAVRCTLRLFILIYPTM
jgi:hypothetical protein